MHLMYAFLHPIWILQRQLFNVWVKTSELRTSVAMQRIKLQQARQAHKLRSILSTHVNNGHLCQFTVHTAVFLKYIWSFQQANFTSLNSTFMYS